MTQTEKVTDIVSTLLGRPEGDVTPSAHFVRDLGADSLDTVEIIIEIERAFDVMIDDEIAESLMTVENIVAHLNTSKL